MSRVIFMVIENKLPFHSYVNNCGGFMHDLFFALIFYNSQSTLCKQMLPTIGYFKGKC